MSSLSVAIDAAFPRWRIPRGIRRRADLPQDTRIVLRHDPELEVPPSLDWNDFNDAALTFRFSREGRAIVVGCDLKAIKARGTVVAVHAVRRSAVMVRLLAGAAPAVPGFTGSLSDRSPDGIVGFCSDGPNAILVPDPVFFNSRGYPDVRRMAGTDPLPWRQRNPEILWRGASTGLGLLSDEDMSGSNPKLIPRTRLCLILKGVPGTDAALADLTQADDLAADRARLEAAGILGSFVGLPEWARRRFAIDVDGNTNAWSNFFNRLLLGCCVIKVQSEHGFRQWYYDDLVPWRHFVPVKPDMSDLVEKIGWCRDHQDECEAIAAEGQKLAMAMTFEREMERGVGTINREFAAGVGTSQVALA